MLLSFAVVEKIPHGPISYISARSQCVGDDLPRVVHSVDHMEKP